MANGAAFDHAIGLAKANPTLDIGCHLTLVGGEGVSGGRLPGSVLELVRWLMERRLNVYEELAAQTRRILQAGIHPTHLDTHKHTHVLPPVLKAVAQVSREFSIPWVRLPFDLAGVIAVPLSVRLARKAMGTQVPRFRKVLAGCRTTDHFIGFELTGRMGPAQMVRALEILPEGFTEFMVHPGFCTDELRSSPTRLKESRVRELKALMSEEVRAVVERRSIVLRAFAI